MSDSAKGGPSSGPAPVLAQANATPVATLERVCFLEWRIEQLACALEDKERLLQQQRVDLAETASRQADASARVSELERMLAEARREAVLLGDRRALDSDLEERLGDSGKVHQHAAQLVRELEKEQRRGVELQRSLESARERIAILESARERFFAKLVQWQRLGSGEQGADLAQFIAELRAEIARLASENAQLSGREAALERELEALRSGGSSVDPELRLPSRSEPALGQHADVDGEPAFAEALRSELHRGGRPLEDPMALLLVEVEESVEVEPLEAVPPEIEARRVECDARPDPDPVNPPSSARAPSAPPLSFAEVRAQLHHALGGTSRARNADRLLFELFEANTALRRGAARALLHLSGVHAAPALALALHAATDSDERVELLGLLARSGAERVRSVIEAAQLDLDPRVRAAALDGLAIHARRDTEVLREPIDRALADRSSRVRRRAVLLLCSLPRFDAYGPLTQVLRDPDPQLRRAACVGLARMPSEPVQRLLASALLDGEPAVRRAAAAGLEPIFGDQVLRIPERSESERRRSVAALRESIAARDEPPERPTATRLFGLGHARRPQDRGVRSGSRSGRPVLAAGTPAGASE